MGNFLIQFSIVFFFMLLQPFLVRAQLPDTRLNDTIIIQNFDTIYCSGGSVPIIATNESGLPITYEIISGNEFISLTDNSTLAPLATGVFVLRGYSSGDAIYKPGYTFVPMRVVSNKESPVLEIKHDLPVRQGEDLRLWVSGIGIGLSCVWKTPTGTIHNALGVFVNNIQEYDAGIYRVSLLDNTCRIASDTLLVEVDANDTRLIIYELITPNNDGNNDVFYIENLERSPNTEVTVFNAWNQVVYHSTEYKNDWDGGGLPVGNYFYLVKEKDCRCEDHRGILYIKK